MIGLSVGVVIMFVQPTFSEIGELQNDIAVYQTEYRKVSEVNNQLSSLIDVLDQVVTDDKRRLLTYMPDEVDAIGVVRDLSLISNEAGVLYLSAVSNGPKDILDDVDEATTFIQPKEHLFELNVEGSYRQFKNLFTLLEQNNYPIEVQNVAILQKDGGFLSMNVSLSVYAYQDSVPSEKIVF
jgi:hypothetical protein